MTVLLKFAAGLPAVAFIGLGIGWWIAPEFAAGLLGMELQGEAGLSSQIGDLASFFITAGIMILAGLRSSNPLWFYPAAILLGVAVLGRLISWAAHGATLTLDFIAVEVAVITLLIFVGAQMSRGATKR